MEKKSLSLSAVITIIVVAALVLSTVIIGAISFTLNRNHAIRLNAQRALAISRSVVAALDVEQFETMMETGRKTDHWYSFKKLIDKIYQENDLFYLYVLDNEYDSEVTYFSEGHGPKSTEEAYDLGDKESVDVHAEEFLDTLDKGLEHTTDIYLAEGFGYMVSGFTPIINSSGQVVGGVGVDLRVDDVVASSNMFGLIIALIGVAICIIMGIFMTLYIRHSIKTPILELTDLAERISMGDMNVAVKQRGRNDEIGRLMKSFQNMIQGTREQASVLDALAEGDLTVDVSPRCASDIINIAMGKMVRNLSKMFNDINAGTAQVSTGSRQISEGAQALARGSADQASAVDELSRSIVDVAGKTKQNADMAARAADLANTIKASAEKGAGQMNLMVSAVNEINDASLSINKVIKVIDDIAFQTNILALNAAVEAARAGQHGKGFAVVAEEVRNLAQKSSESAKSTGSLIANSIEKTTFGVRIADEAAVSLRDIVSGINESSVIINQIADSSQAQSSAIIQINKGIEQVEQVVHQNSITAKQSAAASHDMSAQAETLSKLVGQFKVDNSRQLNGGWSPPLSMPEGR